MKFLSIGEIAARAGLNVSAIRYYENQGLITAMRTAGGNRVFLRGELRRISFITLAQRYGFALEEIAEILAQLPQSRNPTKRDWSKIATHFRKRLNARIAELERMRDKLDGCIGCGCLSLKNCHMYNPDDKAAAFGTGARFVLE